MANGSLGPSLKIERAKKHLRDLEAAVQRHFERNPYEIIVDDNTEAGYREHTVVRADALPPCVSLLTGDVVHALRAALDYLVWQLVIANGGDPQERRTAFPVWRSEAAYKSGRPGDAKGISKDALKVLYGLKPYKGGNEALWRLHQLDIVDKHRLLLPVAAAHRSVVIDPGALMRKLFADTPQAEFKDFPPIPIALNPADHAVIEQGVVLFRSPAGDKTHDDVKFTIEVALSEPKVVESEPLIPALQQLVDFVEEVVALFEPLMSSR